MSMAAGELFVPWESDAAANFNLVKHLTWGEEVQLNFPKTSVVQR